MWFIICLDGHDAETFCVATHKFFRTYDEAKEYAKDIVSGLKPTVVFDYDPKRWFRVENK